MPPKKALYCRSERFAIPLSTSVIMRSGVLTPLTGDIQVSLHGERSLTILENLWRGLLGILKDLIIFKRSKEFIHTIL